MQNVRDPDASVEQRVAKGVMEAFVARQVLGMLESAAADYGLGDKEVTVFTELLKLVSDARRLVLVGYRG